MEWRRKLLTFQLFDAFFAAESLLFHIHLNAFLATAFAHPSPSEHQAASPDKPSPTPLTNSIQIEQLAPVTLIECGVRCGVGLVGVLKTDSCQMLTD